MIKTLRGVGQVLRRPTEPRFARYLNAVTAFALTYAFTMMLGVVVATLKLPEEEFTRFLWMMAAGSLIAAAFGSACAYDVFKHRRWFVLELTPSATRARRRASAARKQTDRQRNALEAAQAETKRVSDAERLRAEFVRAAEALAEHEGQNTLAATMSASDALDVLLGDAKAKPKARVRKSSAV